MAFYRDFLWQIKNIRKTRKLSMKWKWEHVLCLAWEKYWYWFKCFLAWQHRKYVTRSNSEQIAKTRAFLTQMLSKQDCFSAAFSLQTFSLTKQTDRGCVNWNVADARKLYKTCSIFGNIATVLSETAKM